jgi:pimeloyl-ACP methyl ester carboxylesterase
MLQQKKFLIILISITLAAIILSGFWHIHKASLHFKNLQKTHSEYVAVKNGNIEYYKFGSGSPIILIPGYATDVSSWDRNFLAALAQQHQVIVLNNRNVGRSSIQSSRYETRDLANDIYQLIQHLSLQKPAILGISMGGMIAQQLAVMHPDKLGQLILINTVIAGRQAIPPVTPVEKQMLDMPTNLLARYLVALKLFFPASSRMQMAYALAVDRFQPKSYKEIDPAAILPQQRQLVLHWVDDNATAKKISRLNLPVLILNGNADNVIPPINSVILACNIRNSQIVGWKNGGHAMIYQYPIEIANTINHFIAGNN